MRTGSLLLLCLLVTPSLMADEVVLYRCTDSAGALTMQNSPCPEDQVEEKQVMQGVSSVPLRATRSTPRPEPMPADPQVVPLLDSANPRPAAPAPTPADPGAPRLPPPPPPPILFQCTTFDKDTYITENEVPASRCVPLRTVGLDGNPNTGAGEACEMMRDECAPVADGALCAAWKKRLDQVEVAWRFTRAENAEKNRAEFERAQKIWNESSCGQ